MSEAIGFEWEDCERCERTGDDLNEIDTRCAACRGTGRVKRWRDEDGATASKPYVLCDPSDDCSDMALDELIDTIVARGGR